MWQQKVKERNEIPSWSNFDQFLTMRYQTLETVADLRAPSTFHLQRDFDRYQFNNETNNSYTSCQSCPNEQLINAQLRILFMIPFISTESESKESKHFKTAQRNLFKHFVSKGRCRELGLHLNLTLCN